MFHRCTSCALVVFLASAYYILYYVDKTQTFKNSSSIVIGILSGRENFKHRQLIRDTWLQSKYLQQQGLSLDKLKALFIIGNKSCDVPPQCRKSKYSCERGNVDFSVINESFCACNEAHYTDHEETFHQGFSFQVNHPVIVTKLGVFSKLLSHEDNIQISLRDLQSQEVVVNTSIGKNYFDVEVGGYLYRYVENFLLPKNYQGLLLVEGPLLMSHCSSLDWNDNGKILSFERIFPSSDAVESIVFTEQLRTAPSIGFQVIKMEDLNRTSVQCSNFDSWEQYNRKIQDQLETEQKAYGDILFVNMVDTYRALPSKLLHFYDWLVTHYHFNYVLKTDDDCMLDVSKIMQHLQHDEQFNPEKMWIWSRFRSRWPVNYVGKWADYDYKSPVYPLFPCGGAYVLSYKTVYWLQKNKNDLFPYQGEDVSLGIWLSAVNPVYINDKRWECDDSCSVNSFNRAQLQLEDMALIWKLKEECGNICRCDPT